jgi:hypothetical protein
MTHLQIEAADLKTLLSQRDLTLADLSSKVDALKGDLEVKGQEVKGKQALIDSLQQEKDGLQVKIKITDFAVFNKCLPVNHFRNI